MATAAQRKNVIGNFYVDRVDLKVMRTFVKKNKIKLDADETNAEQYAVALTQHFREAESDPDKFAQCETCHGESPEIYEACPFCGLEAGAEDVEEEEGDEGEVDGDADERDDEVEVDEPDEEEPPPESSPAPKAKDEPRLVTKSEKAVAKEKKAKKSAAAEKPSTALATTTSAAMSVKLLDDAIDRVYALKVAGAEAFWKLGHEILILNRDGLWKQRVSEDGTQRYASFEAFCTHELQMSGTYALDIMRTARDFTMAQIAAMGRKNATLVWKAAPEDRKQIAEKAAAGATTREIAKDVKASREKHKVVERGSVKAQAGAKGAKAQAEKKAAREEKAIPEKITVAKLEGMKTVKLYAKPASMKNLNFDDLKRAKAIKDVPYGKLDLANGVAMYFTLFVDKTGALAVKVNTQRESPIA